MTSRLVARLALISLALLSSLTTALAGQRQLEPGERPRLQRRPMTRADVLRHDLQEAASSAPEHVSVGAVTASDPQGDLSCYFVDASLRQLSGSSVGHTVPGGLVTSALFDTALNFGFDGCSAFSPGGGSDIFTWQKGMTVAGGTTITYSLSGSNNVTWSVDEARLANPTYRDYAGVICSQYTPDLEATNEVYQFSIDYLAQGRWQPYYFWFGPGYFADGLFNQFEIPAADITGVSAAEASGGFLDFNVTVAGGIPSANSATRPVFLLYARPTGQTGTPYVSIEAINGAWKGVLYDSATGFRLADSALKSDLPVTVSGNSATVRVDTRDLLLSGSKLNIFVSSYAVLSVSEEEFEGRVDTASAVLQLTEVTIGRLPQAMVQPANSAGATTEFSLINNGASAASINLGASGSFFSLSASAVTIPPGEAATVRINGNAAPAGDYSGSVTLSGSGLAGGTTLPVRLLSIAPPSQPPLPRGLTRTAEARPPSVTTYESSVEFRNEGAGTVSGLLSSDVQWITPQSAPVSIAPGATQSLSYTIDRTKRLYSSQPGSSSGTLTLSFLNATSSARSALDDSGTGLATVVVIDTVKPPTGATTIAPLAPNELALFLAGVEGSSSDWVTDVNIAPNSSGIPALSMFFVPEGGTASAFTLNNVGSAGPVKLADAVSSVFDQEAVGTFLFRGSSLGSLQLSGLDLNVGGSRGTFGTAIPVLRTDRAAKAAETLQMTGLTGRSPNARTDLFLQEVAGFASNVTIDYLGANGQIVESTQKSLGAFAMLRITDAVPANGVTARVAVDAGSQGKVSGYAMTVDLVSGDKWVSADWPRLLGYTATSVSVIPVGGSITGINGTRFGTSLSLFNPGVAPVIATLTFHSDTASGAPTTADVTIDAKQTKSYANVVEELFHLSGRALGYIRIDSKGAALLSTSRTWSTSGSGSTTFAMGAPSIAVSKGIKKNSSKRITGVEDSSPEIFLAKAPGTFRTNLGLLETGGAAATVQVTLNYEYAKSGSLAAALASKSKTFELAPNSFRLLWSLTQELLGDLRSTLGSSIRSMSIDVKVIDGTGTVEVFATAVDNASGDQQLKME